MKKPLHSVSMLALTMSGAGAPGDKLPEGFVDWLQSLEPSDPNYTKAQAVLAELEATA